jgi:hypothetical protein
MYKYEKHSITHVPGVDDRLELGAVPEEVRPRVRQGALLERERGADRVVVVHLVCFFKGDLEGWMDELVGWLGGGWMDEWVGWMGGWDASTHRPTDRSCINDRPTDRPIGMYVCKYKAYLVVEGELPVLVRLRELQHRVRLAGLDVLLLLLLLLLWWWWWW